MNLESIRSIGGNVFTFMRAVRVQLIIKGWVLSLSTYRPRRHRETFIPVNEDYC